MEYNFSAVQSTKMHMNRNLLLFSQVRQYYAKFKKTGNPRTAKIEKTEFCDIMQVHWDFIDKPYI